MNDIIQTVIRALSCKQVLEFYLQFNVCESESLYCVRSLYYMNNAPVIWNPGPYGAADSGDIAEFKCRDLTSDESQQCRRRAGVLISR